MRDWRYLNVILTVNALLLAALLWTQIVAKGPVAHPALAQSTLDERALAVPNASNQRQAIIDGLGDVRDSVEATRRLLESGNARVRVTNMPELTAK